MRAISSRRTRWRRQLCAAIAIVLALTACGEAATSDPVSGADEASVAPATAPADSPPSDGATDGATDTASAATDPSTAASPASAAGLEGASLHAVAAGPDGVLVAVGSDGTSAAAWTTTGDDGWQPADVEDGEDVDRLRAVSSGAGGFVAFGGGDDQPSTGWTSDAGTVWTPTPTPGVRVRVNAVAADGDGWVAVGDRIAREGGGTEAGVVLRSADGVTWEVVTDRLRVGDGTVSDVAVDDGTIVAVGFDTAGGRIWRDPTTRRRPVDGDFAGTAIQGVAATGDGFVALGQGVGDLRPLAWTSTDGRTWERHDLDADGFPPTDEINDLTATETGLVAAGSSPDGGVVWTSTDGVTWTRSAP